MEGNHCFNWEKPANFEVIRKESLLPRYEMNSNTEAFLFWSKGGKNLEML